MNRVNLVDVDGNRSCDELLKLEHMNLSELREVSL